MSLSGEGVICWGSECRRVGPVGACDWRARAVDLCGGRLLCRRAAGWRHGAHGGLLPFLSGGCSLGFARQPLARMLSPGRVGATNSRGSCSAAAAGAGSAPAALKAGLTNGRGWSGELHAQLACNLHGGLRRYCWGRGRQVAAG